MLQFVKHHTTSLGQHSGWGVKFRADKLKLKVSAINGVSLVIAALDV